MRAPTALALLAAAIPVGCAPPGSDPGLERSRRLLAQAEADLQAAVAVPLGAYLTEPPGSCESANLTRAIAAAADAPYRRGVGHSAFERDAMAGSWTLDVADAAAARDCPEVARTLYLQVMRRYVGPVYGELRDRALVGLAQLGGAP